MENVSLLGIINVTKGEVKGYTEKIHCGESSSDWKDFAKGNIAMSPNPHATINCAADAANLLWDATSVYVGDIVPAIYVEFPGSKGYLAEYQPKDKALIVYPLGKAEDKEILAVIMASVLYSNKMRELFEKELSARQLQELVICLTVGKDPGKRDRRLAFKISDGFLWGFCDPNAIVDYLNVMLNRSQGTKAVIERYLTAGALQKKAGPGSKLFPEKADTGSKPAEPEKTETDFTMSLDKFYEQCKRGKYVINYPWNDIQKQYIVPLDFLDTYVPTECFRKTLLSVYYQLMGVMARMGSYEKTLKKKQKADPEYSEPYPYGKVIGNPINVKIMGKPGTGKTVMIEAVLASLGYPKGIINCKGRMEEDDIEGLNKFIQGTVVSIPTKCGELHSVGGAIVLEEVNLPDPDILQGALGQALVYPYILKVNGYQEYRRHPMTIYFATMNIGTQGSKPLNEALSSRFPEGHILEDISREEFISVLAANGNKKRDCNTVYNIYRDVLNYLGKYAEDIQLSITMRHCINCLEQIKVGFPIAEAVNNTFISQVYSIDPEVAKDLQGTLPCF